MSKRTYSTKKKRVPVELMAKYSIERCVELLTEDSAACDSLYEAIQRSLAGKCWTEGSDRRKAAKERAARERERLEGELQRATL